MGIFSFIKRRNPFKSRKPESHPRALLRNLRTLGWYWSMTMPKRRREPLQAMREVVFPDFRFTDPWVRQEYLGAVESVRNMLGVTSFRTWTIRNLIKVCKIERTPQVQAALSKLEMIDHVEYDIIQTNVMMDMSVQLQIILDAPSKHPDWRPPNIIDVSVTEVRPLQLN